MEGGEDSAAVQEQRKHEGPRQLPKPGYQPAACKIIHGGYK